MFTHHLPCSCAVHASFISFLAVPRSSNLYSLVDSSAGVLFNNMWRHSKILNEIANLYFFVVLIKDSPPLTFHSKTATSLSSSCIQNSTRRAGHCCRPRCNHPGQGACASTPTGLRARPENGHLLAIELHPLSDVSLWGGELTSG